MKRNTSTKEGQAFWERMDRILNPQPKPIHIAHCSITPLFPRRKPRRFQP